MAAAVKSDMDFEPAPTIVRARRLHSLGRVGLASGELLKRAVTFLVLSSLFFLGFTPIAWVMRLLGKDLLSLQRHPELESYWIDRSAAARDPQSMRSQFW